ncbi:hypothetical protein KSI01_28830 [Kurthia sibirica]|nr:hypothetical protein KSI01_28830 [Kurthia sibirica]
MSEKKRKTITVTIINTIVALTGGYSVGDAVVAAAIKKVFKNRTYKKKGRTFYFFGKKQTYDYLRIY